MPHVALVSSLLQRVFSIYHIVFMEVEVKLTLKDVQSYNNMLNAMGTNAIKEYQEDFFFDGPNGELRAANVCLRLRLCGNSCDVTVKENADVNDGSSVRWQHSEKLHPALGRAISQGQQPISGTVAHEIAGRFGVDSQSLRLVGGLRCVRTAAP